MDIERTQSSDGIFNSILSQIDSFLGGKDGAAGHAQAGGSTDNSLVQQLHELYAEIEASGGRRPAELAEENAALLSEAETLRQQIEGLEAACRTGVLSSAPAIVPLADASAIEAGLNEQLSALYAEIEEAGGRRPAELSEVVDQLVAQLDSLYADIEKAGGYWPTEMRDMMESLVEQLHALYAEKEGGGAQDPAMLDSLVEQLHALYAEKEQSGGGADDRDVIIDSLTSQLHDLYAEKEHGGSGEHELIIESLTAQLHDLYAEKEHGGGSADSAMVDSLVEQLHALYAEKENGGGSSGDAEIIESLTAQLHDLYSEKEHGGGRLDEMVRSLEEQVCAFAEEKLELEAQVDDLSREIEQIRARARTLVSAVAEGALRS